MFSCIKFINLSQWDIAAGKLIIEEAGGIVKVIEGKREISIIAGSRVMTTLIYTELESVGL